MTRLTHDASSFTPIQVLCVDIDGDLPGLTRQSGSSTQEFSRAMILVRLHLSPIGIMEVDIPLNGMTTAELSRRIWDLFKPEIQDHLLVDQTSSPDGLDEAGISRSETPTCLREQQRFLLDDVPFVSVVIASRNRVESLQACLISVLQLDYPNYEVIVVDSAPEDETTADLVRSPEFYGKVHYIREAVPGLAIAHNRALAETDAPIVAVTDDDVIVDRFWLKSIVANFQRDAEVACVTGMILPYEIATLPQLWIEQFGGFGKGFERKVFDRHQNRPSDKLYPYSAGQFGSGANMAFRTPVLQSIGGFDPSLGAGTPAKGGDDLAVFFDIITRGYRLVYEPGAILYHKHHRDYSGLIRQAYGYGIGLSAFLTRVVMNEPRRVTEILWKIPAGLKHMLDPRSKKNHKKNQAYPSELTRLELKGFLQGPLAYVRSRLKMRRLANRLPQVGMALRPSAPTTDA